MDGVNHAPFAAFGGWSGGVNAAADDAVKDAAYDFFSYVSQPEQSNADVTVGATGFNPLPHQPVRFAGQLDPRPA